MKKTICFLLIGLLSLFGILLILCDRISMQKETDQIEQLKQEAASYEEEIRQLERELSSEKRELTAKAGIPSVLVGFVPASVDDVERIQQLTADYNLTTVIILDCSLDIDILEQIAEQAEEENYEIVLAGITFDEGVLENAEIIRSEINPDCAFLLREKDDTTENRDLLYAHRFNHLILFSQSCESGILETATTENTEQETATQETAMTENTAQETATTENTEQETATLYLSYGFLNTQTALASITGRIQDSGNRVLAIFNMKEINEGTLTEENITADLRQLSQMLDQGRLQSPSLSVCYQELQEEISRQQEKQAEYDAFSEEIQAQIQKLQSAVNAIYGTWE